MTPIRVVVAGVPRTVGRCRALLEDEAGIAIAAHAGSPVEASLVIARRRPDVLVLDLAAWSFEALAVLPAIRRSSPSTRVLVVTTSGVPDSLVLEALKRGARGCLARAALGRFLARSVRAIAGEEPWVPRRMVGRILQELRACEEIGAGVRDTAAAPGRRRPA